MNPVNLRAGLDSFHEHWAPRIIAELNGQEVKIVKFAGDFVWHSHAEGDELFFVIRGRFRMDFRDRSTWLEEGELIVIPRGVEHKPFAEAEVEVMLFEPAGTVNTGEADDARRVDSPLKIEPPRPGEE